ncbi:MAG TPA: prenyltransferase/squalene oxidase repeat-containing protein [Thermoguttaceae bacterium]|nr:prenyltransferase/squalene oxidase repeat-containing protein [Thermoguttaceae bacterium]
MSTASHDSSTELERSGVPLGAPASAEGSGRSLWLDGDVLACSCPECGAPMSIRLWLMVADCFRCGTSLELTEEQEQEALRLLRQQEETQRQDSQAAAAAIAPTMLRKPKPRTQPKPADAEPAAEPTTVPATAPHRQPTPRRVSASEAHRGTRALVRDLYERGRVAVLWRSLLKDLPAWLISLVVHLVAMLLLLLFGTDPTQGPPTITLSTSVSYEDLEGGQELLDEPLEETFDLGDAGGLEQISDLNDPGALIDLDQPILPPDDPSDRLNIPGRLPARIDIQTNEIPPSTLGRMFSGRDPRIRRQAVAKAGGTTATEAAVARALIFLSRHQHEDGSWSLADFNKSANCDRTCTGQVGDRDSDSRVAATALSLLPFLGAGQTHKTGPYKDQIRAGLTWLLEHQREDGDLRDRNDEGEVCGRGKMYAHGQAAIALCEAYALTGDPDLRGPAQRALNFIVRAQHPNGGGWRYVPREPGDTSVVGWQLMALKSGQMGYLSVPSKTFERAGLFLNSVTKDGAHYGYQGPNDRGGLSALAMTAEALLCRQYLGWPRDHDGLKRGVDYLLENLPDARHPNVYYWYYATQVMHHYGGDAWEKWNASMQRALLGTQETRGHAAGSWAPQGGGLEGGFATDKGGRIFMTALATCMLEVYYRHMPIYSEDALEGVKGLEDLDVLDVVEEPDRRDASEGGERPQGLELLEGLE